MVIHKKVCCEVSYFTRSDIYMFSEFLAPLAEHLDCSDNEIPAHLKHVTCTQADNILQGSVVTYLRCGGGSLCQVCR